MAEMNPHNRYQIAQLVGFSVNEMIRPQMNLLQMLGDAKSVPIGSKAAFKVPMEGVKAFIQAKGSTTPRSKVASKQVFLETVAISARPVLNIYEMQSGQAQMSDLINQAAREIEDKQNKYIYDVLVAAAANWTTPFYGSGAGIVKATLNPMLQHWMRVGGATIVGDIAIISKLADETGFTAYTNATTTSGTTVTKTGKQFTESIINEQNANGFIGRYYGADVVQLVNPYANDGTTTLLDVDKLFILPKSASVDMRPLKILREGDVKSTEATNIDDLTYEIRLDQYFGAGIVTGKKPYMSMYNDSTL